MYVITGATGNTGKVAAEALLAKGEKVRVIGRDAKKLKPFVQKGAEAFVGNVEDQAAMTQAFAGAKAVYFVLPQALEREDFAPIRTASATRTPARPRRRESSTPYC